MSAQTLAGLFLRLYPRRYRERFGDEWIDVVEWHSRALRGAPLARVRLLLVLAGDVFRSLPSAWIGLRRGGPDPRHRRPGRQGGSDVRHALRALARNPVFTLAAIASVAMGIGANTAMFSVANAVLLRPLPYAGPDRLVIVWNEFPGAALARLPLSGPEVQLLREQPGLFEDVAGVWATSGTVTGRDGRAAQVSLGRITPNFFGLLGLRPGRGRFHEQDGAGRVPAGVILSDEFWTTRYGGDPEVVGSTIDLNGQPVEVIGVLPAGFTLFFPEDGAIPSRFDVYSALAWDLSVQIPDQHYLRVIGRLRDGVSLAEAASGVAAVAERAKQTYPQLQSTGDRFTVHPLHEDTVRAARPVLLALLGGVALFLLLASTNVASLIVARTASRGRELAIRSSLGASRAVLARLVVVESLLVTIVGALLGIGLGQIGVKALWSARPAGLSRASAVPLDGRVLGFSIAIAVAAAVAFSLVSLVAVRGADPSLRMHGGGGLSGRFGRRVRELLTAAQVATGLVLVMGSALMVRSLNSLGAESIGFEPGTALTFRVPLDLNHFPDDADRNLAATEIERRVAELPGVQAVGATSHLPFVDWANWADAAPPEGTPVADRNAFFADLRAVTPAYLQAIGSQLVTGRFFDERDGPDGAPVVIIDETMAARAFPDEDPIGRVLEPARFYGGQFVNTPATVVGVIHDIRDRSPSQASGGQVFWPFGQSPRWELTFYVRATGDPVALADDVQRTVTGINADLTAARLVPMSDYVATATALTRFLARIGSLFSVMALAVAAIGLYGVVAYVTIQRTHEIALRVALGATSGEILGGVVGHGLRIGALGVALGLAGSLMLNGLLESLVYGVSARDPATLIAVAVLLVAISLIASMAPARRATRLDPVTALRQT